jgi:hypothetical protein
LEVNGKGWLLPGGKLSAADRRGSFAVETLVSLGMDARDSSARAALLRPTSEEMQGS